jgi:hypothetical protein
MAESTGSATDLEDFFSSLITYAVSTHSWTQNEAIGTVDSGRQFALSKGNCFVQFRWDTTTPNTVAVYQSTGYTASNRAGDMPGDSGNGYNATNVTTEAFLLGERCVAEMGDSAYPNYYLYSNSTGDFIHAVVEIATGEFRHFGFGTDIDKFGDWDSGAGGAYCYGHYGAHNSSQQVGTSQGCLLDGLASTAGGGGDQRSRQATMRLTGMPGQTSEVWAHIWGNKSTTELVDDASNPRSTVIGGARGSMMARAWGGFPAGSSSGLAPTQPLGLWYVNKTTSPPRVYLLGFMPETRMVHLKYQAAADTFTLGSDTWRVFPVSRRVEGVTAGDSGFQGIAYNTSA